MSARVVVVTVALAALAPRPAAADRGALTVEVAPALTLVPNPPSQGVGSTTMGSAGGGLVGVRYALRNDLEVTATGFWEAPANYFHEDVQITTPTGTYAGTLSERTGRYGALVGVRFVRGLEWRVHLGAELGWSHQSYTSRDLVNISDPANPHSYGLGLQDVSSNSFVISPLAGIEWQVGDRWSFAVTPRLEFMLGSVNHAAVVVPLSVEYSWFVF